MGQAFHQLCVGVGEVQLHFDGGLSLRFETDIMHADGASAPVPPYTLDGLSLLIPLLNADVTGVGVNELGGLSLTVGRTELHCAGHPDYEAWNLSGPNGVLVVCAPGGDLAVWSAE
jgi:hypothetical protein